MGGDENLTAYVPVRMPPALKKRLQAAAEVEHRSTSGQALRFIEQGLRRRDHRSKAS
jgi:hypothetical protein